MALSVGAPLILNTDAAVEKEYQYDSIVAGLGPDHALVGISSWDLPDYNSGRVSLWLVKRSGDTDLVQVDTADWQPVPSGDAYVETLAAVPWDDEHALLMQCNANAVDGTTYSGIVANPLYDSCPSREPDDYADDGAVLAVATRDGDSLSIGPCVVVTWGYAATLQAVALDETRILVAVHEQEAGFRCPAGYYQTRVLVYERTGDSLAAIADFAPFTGAPVGMADIGDGRIMLLNNVDNDGMEARVYEYAGGAVSLAYTSGLITDFDGGAGSITFPQYFSYSNSLVSDLVGVGDGVAVLGYGFTPDYSWADSVAYAMAWTYDGSSVSHGSPQALGTPWDNVHIDAPRVRGANLGGALGPVFGVCIPRGSAYDNYNEAGLVSLAAVDAGAATIDETCLHTSWSDVAFARLSGGAVPPRWWVGAMGWGGGDGGGGGPFGAGNGTGIMVNSTFGSVDNVQTWDSYGPVFVWLVYDGEHDPCTPPDLPEPIPCPELSIVSDQDAVTLAHSDFPSETSAVDLHVQVAVAGDVDAMVDLEMKVEGPNATDGDDPYANGALHMASYPTITGETATWTNIHAYSANSIMGGSGYFAYGAPFAAGTFTVTFTVSNNDDCAPGAPAVHVITFTVT